MARNVTFAPGEHYHVYNRGTEKRRIFTSRADYERFLALLYASNSTRPTHLFHQGHTFDDLSSVERGEQLVKINAYCLMPNHFHLVLHESYESGISRFLQKLLTGYTMYFNKKTERTGTLFEGRTKARHADDDVYLKYLISYVHLNPVTLLQKEWNDSQRYKNDAREYLQQYRYSSYLDFSGESRKENIILDTSSLPAYFQSTEDFDSEIRGWLAYRQDIEA